MDRFERIARALSFEEPDKVPLWDLLNIPRPLLDTLTGKASSKLRATLEEVEDDITFPDVDAYCALGWDMITVGGGRPKGYKPKVLENGVFVDEMGGRWKIIEKGGWPYPHLVGGTIETPEDFENFEFPDPYAEGRMEPLRKMMKAAKERIPLVWLSTAVWQPLFTMMGIEGALRNLYMNPSFVHKAARKWINFNIEMAKMALDEGVIGVAVGDDWCYKKGPMMNIGHFKEFIYPYFKEYVDVVRRRGGWFMKHTDGWVIPLIDLIIEAGVDALNPLEPEAGMELGFMKKKYGDKLCLAGNVRCGATLDAGTVEQTKTETLECIRKGGPGGGYILTTSNSIHLWSKPENVKAMFETSKKYGWYPIKGIKPHTG